MKKRLSIMLAMLLALCMVLSACGGGGATPSGGGSTSGGGSAAKENPHPTLRIPVAADVTQLDPHVSSGSDYNVFGAIFNNLVKFDNGNQFKALPSLARSWEISDDQLEWTFHLVETNWHDGTPFTAEDVAFSINRMVAQPATASKVLMIDHAEAVDEHTAKMYCKYAYPNLILQLCSWPWKMVSKAAVEKYGDGNNELAKVGTGPYKLEKIDAGKTTLVRNDDYFDEPAFFERIEMITMTDDATRLAALENGELDYAVVSTGMDADYIRSQSDRFYLHEQTRAGVYCIMMNQAANPALAIKEVRQAMRYAVDAEAIGQLVFDGETLGVAHTVLSPGEEGYTETGMHYEYDPTKAKELLKQAGYENKLTIKFSYATLDAAERFAATAKEYFEAVGITVEMVPTEPSALAANAYTGAYEVMFTEFQSIPYNPPLVYRLYFLSTGSLNYSKVKDPHIDDLADRAGRELDDAKRRALYEELDHYIQEQAIYIPTCYMKYNYAFNKHVKGYGFEPNTLITAYDKWYWEE